MGASDFDGGAASEGSIVDPKQKDVTRSEKGAAACNLKQSVEHAPQRPDPDLLPRRIEPAPLPSRPSRNT
jgi:hypothetical protein